MNTQSKEPALSEKLGRLILIFAAIASASLALSQGHAQSAEARSRVRTAATESEEATREDTIHDLDAVTVTSTRTERRAFEVPGMTSVVDQQSLEITQPQNVGDTVRSLPNVEMYGGPRRSAETPTIRGRSQEHVLILVDGMRQNYIHNRNGRLFLEPDMLKQVEVVRGPNSALYGSSAQGGTIAMRTKDALDLLGPGRSTGARLKTGYASVNDEVFYSAAGYAATGGLDLLAMGTYRDGGNVRLGTGDDLEFSGSEVKSGLFKASYKTVGGQTFALSHDITREKSIQPTIPSSTSTTSIVNRKAKVDSTLARYLLNPSNSDLLDLELSAYQVETGNYDLGYSASLVDRDDRRIVKTSGASLVNRSRIEAASLGRHRLTYGAEVFKDESTIRRWDTGVPLPILYNPDGQVRYESVFLQDEIDVTETVSLIPGIRYDTYESDSPIAAHNSSDDSVSLKLGAVYRPKPYLFLFGLYSEGFVAPNLNQLFRLGTHYRIGNRQQDFRGNLDLRAETSKSYEAGIGLEFRFDNAAHFQAKLSVFTQDAKNTITTEIQVQPTVPPDLAAEGVTQYEYSKYINLDGAEYEGAELEVGYSTRSWYVNASGSTMTSREKTRPRKLDTTPADKLSVNGGIRIPAANLTLGGNALFVGSRAGKVYRDSYKTAGYSVWGLYAVWRPAFLGDSTSLNLNVNNLFDKAYERSDLGRYSAGRSAQAALTVRF